MKCTCTYTAMYLRYLKYLQVLRQPKEISTAIMKQIVWESLASSEKYLMLSLMLKGDWYRLGATEIT